MAKIEGFRVKNFRALKEVTLGRLMQKRNAEPLTAITAVIGKNGVGKSTLFDAFGFLADCFQAGVEEACDLRGRGGFEKIHSLGQVGAIEFEIYYKEETNSRPITYELAIDLDNNGRPYVLRERLRQRRKGQKRGWPFSFLILEKGSGIVWKGDREGIDERQENFDLFGFIESVRAGEEQEESQETEVVELEDPRMLGIATLGSLKQHPRISAFRKFILGWYLSYFTPDSAREQLPQAGMQKHLDGRGANLSNVVQYMERAYPKRLDTILADIAKKIPGIDKISTEISNDKRLLLKFSDKGFSDPFYLQQVSDGTIKVFTYLLLLEDPAPAPFLCIEEPENGLYHKLLEILARELRDHSRNRKGGSQIFITTHQPYFVDALEPDEVWILEKGDDGFSNVRRASEDILVVNMVNEGIPLGSLWYSDYFELR